MKHNDQRGITHIIQIVVVAVLVLGVAGLIVWRMWGANNNQAKNDALQQAIAKAQCTGLNDKDLCKFFTSFKTQKFTTVTSTIVADGKTSTSMYQADGNNYHTTLKGTVDYEAISIGQDLYVKNGNTWWKQTIPATDTSKYNLSTDSDVSFTEPLKGETYQQNYQKLDNEKCGNLKCFKYQLLDPTNTSNVTYVWFDTTDYQLRRMQMTATDGTSTDSTFDYAKVTVSVPNPVQTLAPNQYILPGQSEPVTVPSQSDLENMLNTTE